MYENGSDEPDRRAGTTGENYTLWRKVRVISSNPPIASLVVRAIVAIHRPRNEDRSRCHDHGWSNHHRRGDRHEDAAREANGDGSREKQRSGQAADLMRAMSNPPAPLDDALREDVS